MGHTQLVQLAQPFNKQLGVFIVPLRVVLLVLERVQPWRRGDADTLWATMAVAMREQFPKLYYRINVARNDAWVERLEGKLQRPGTDDTLVVVGALHLLGEDGVVEKLRARGYEVERICSACRR